MIDIPEHSSARSRFEWIKMAMQVIYNEYYVIHHGLDQLLDPLIARVHSPVRSDLSFVPDKTYFMELSWDDFVQPFYMGDDLGGIMANEYDRKIYADEQLQKFIPSDILHSSHGPAWIEMYLVDPFNSHTMIGHTLFEKLKENGLKITSTEVHASTDQIVKIVAGR